MTYTLHHGDCLGVLPAFPANSFDSIVCDPPYGISFMGKDWDHGVPGVPFWVEAMRVAKPGAMLLAFGGTRTVHRLACAIEDAGWEIRDTIIWLYGQGFPKSLNVGDGRGTGLKPSHEPIILARKPFPGTVVANVLEWGTGGLNIDATRVGTNGEARALLEVRGDIVTSSDSGHKYGTRVFGSKAIGTTSLGRWPANILHDGSDEVLAVFPVTTSGAMNSTAKGGQFNTFGKQCARQVKNDASTGSAARFFYCAKASRADRDQGLEDAEMRKRDESRNEGDPGGDNPRNRGAAPRHNHHPTVKPTSLMRYLCRLVTPPGGTVLDPFAGSGSTGKGAVLEGFNFVGIEQDKEYCSIAKARIGYAVADEVFGLAGELE